MKKDKKNNRYLVNVKYEVVDLDGKKKTTFVKKGRRHFAVKDPRMVKEGMKHLKRFSEESTASMSHQGILSRLFNNLKIYAGTCNRVYYRMLRT